MESDLQELEQTSLYRRRQELQSPQGIHIRLNGHQLVNFCSNDYLGLANHPAVINAFKKAVDKWGVGSGSAHLICGHNEAHHRLEEELAEFTGRQRAVLFSSGYMANLGAITALVGPGDRVFEDRLNHASLLDGGMLSRARFQRYQHCDVEALKRRMAGGGEKRCLVVSDGVFSMDGDLAPVRGLAKQCRPLGAILMVDDAHGLGVIGQHGRGTLEHFDASQKDVPVLVGTLGKAFGTFGAFIAGSEVLAETIIQKSRSYIYTTALPPAVAEASRVSLELIKSESWRREKLHLLIARFRNVAQDLGLRLSNSVTPIQPIIIGDSRLAMNLSRELQVAGFLCSAIRPPTVPGGSARLRVTLSAQHEESHIDRFLEVLAGLAKDHA